MNRFKLVLIVGFLLNLTYLVQAAPAADVAVVVHRDVPVDNLTSSAGKLEPISID